MKSKTLITLQVIILVMAVSSAWATGAGMEGKKAPGATMREHIADCSQCAKKTKRIAALREKLKEINSNIRDHRWEKNQTETRKLQRKAPGKKRGNRRTHCLKKKN